MNIRYVLPTLFLTASLHAQTLFDNDSGAGDGNLLQAANWDNGLPDGAGVNPGTLPIDATWADPLGSTDAADNQLADFDFAITDGATVTRGLNFIPEFTANTDIVISNGLLDIDAGTGSRNLRLRDTASVTVESNGTLTVPSNRTIEIFDSSEVVVDGGIINGESINNKDSSTAHAFLTFTSNGGLVDLSALLGFEVGALGYVNFEPGATGALDIAAADQTYYEGLWTAGQLKFDDANTGAFGDHFVVAGGVLSLAGGSDPKMHVEASYSFDNTGGVSTPSITATNLGASMDLVITSVTATETGTAIPESTVSGILFDTPVAASGGTGLIGFNFTPTGPGVYNFDLNIFSNDAEESSPRVVPISITVTEPLISVDSTGFDLGILPHNPGDQVSVISVTNTSDGALNLNITGTPISGDTGEFTVTSTPGPIAPGLTGDIEVTFNPGTSHGVFNATLDIQSNDYNGEVPQVSFEAFVEPDATPAARIDFGSASSPVQNGYVQFVGAEDASKMVEGVTVVLDSRDSNVNGATRSEGDDLRIDMARTGSSGGTYLSVLLSGFSDGTLNLVTSHNLSGTSFEAPQEILFGEQGGTLTTIATDVTRNDWVELATPVETGKTYELRMRESSSVNRAYISSLLMWGPAVPGGTVYDGWASTYGLDPDWSAGDPALDGRPDSDPDNDGKNNRDEFGTDDDPTNPQSSGKVVGKVANVGGQNALTLTLPVRGAPAFNPDGPTNAGLASDAVDGIIYRLQGARDLVFEGLNESQVTEVTPAIDTGLPALNSGWTYRTFRTAGNTATDPADFIRVLIEEDTP